jgi:hypothetical protein
VGSELRVAVEMDEGLERLRVAHDFRGKQVCRLGSKSAKKGLQAIPNSLQDAAEGKWLLDTPPRPLVALAIDGDAKIDAHSSEPADVFVNKGNLGARKAALEQRDTVSFGIVVAWHRHSPEVERRTSLLLRPQDGARHRLNHL